MKRHIKKEQFLELPPKAQMLIFDWQKKKGYSYDPALSIGDCIELLTEITRKLRKDDGFHGWRDNVLELDEVTIAYEGELIDSLFYEITVALKKYLSSIPFSDIV